MYENGRIVGFDLTGRLDIEEEKKFASLKSRTHRYYEAERNPYGSNGLDAEIAFDLDEDHFEKNEPDAVRFLNSRLDLEYDLPSTKNVSRFNAQNKEGL
jgi:hypothetical protein